MKFNGKKIEEIKSRVIIWLELYKDCFQWYNRESTSFFQDFVSENRVILYSG